MDHIAYPNIDMKSTGKLIKQKITQAGYSVKDIQELLMLSCQYSNGTIWKSHFDANLGEWSTRIKIIDEDVVLQILNDKANSLYSSLYVIDSDNNTVFNEAYEIIARGWCEKYNIDINDIQRMQQLEIIILLRQNLRILIGSVANFENII